MSDKQNIGNQALISPMAILGTEYNGKPNLMALGWAMWVNYKPCLAGVCVHATGRWTASRRKQHQSDQRNFSP